MWKKIALVSLGLWFFTLGVAGYFFINGNTKKTEDGRTSVKLLKEERYLVLGEMRALLSGVQGIIEAVTVNDLKFIEETSRSLGMKAAADVKPGLMAKLPIEFKSTGMSVHKRFDELANKVHSGMSKDEVLKEVSDIMRTCVSCHEAFRLDETN